MQLNENFSGKGFAGMKKASVVTSVEKGTFWLLVSNIIFFLSGYIVYIGLGRFLLSLEEFGVFGVIMALNSVTNLVLLVGIHQATAKFVSENEENAEAVKNASLKVQAVFSVLFFVVYFLFAPFIALALNDASMTPLIQLSAVIILFQPILSVLMGYLNGMKRFKQQALLRIVYRGSRVLLVLGFAVAGFSLFGAVAGLVLSTILAFAIGFLWVGVKKVKTKFSYQKIVYFAVPIIFLTLIQRALLSVDLFFVKSFLPAAQAGYYTAAQTLSILPHDLVAFTFSMVLFPLISKATYQGNSQKTRFYIKNAFRYSLLVLAPLVVLIATTAPQLVSLLYLPKYAVAGVPLAILSLGVGFFSLFIISTTIISGSGKPNLSALIGFVAVLASIAFNFFLVPRYGLNGAAAASALALFVGFLIAGSYVLVKFKALISAKSSAKILFAALIVLFISNYWFLSGWFVVIKWAVLLLVYAGLLWLLKEFNATDFAVVKNLLPEGLERDS